MNSEEFVDDIMANLKVIGMLQKNGKLCVRKGKLAIDDEGHLQFVRRWLRRDSRDSVLMHMKNTITNAINVSKVLLNESKYHDLDKWTLMRLNEEMRGCELGIINLKTTYNGDAMMVASLDVLIERLKASYEDITRKMDGRTSASAAATTVNAGTNTKNNISINTNNTKEKEKDR